MKAQLLTTDPANQTATIQLDNGQILEVPASQDLTEHIGQVGIYDQGIFVLPAAPPILPILAADPTNPVHGQAWVMKTPTTSSTGEPLGLLLGITQTIITGYTYELSIYDNDTDTILRTALT